MTEALPRPTESSFAFPRTTLSVGEAAARGRSLRTAVPRRSLAAFVVPDRDPVTILEDQHRDRLSDLVPIRVGRMLQSPFSYYRGAAAVMAHDLADEPRTGVELVVCGDAHLANFGVFASPDRRVLFDLNDFDETAFAPWEWDVKRLVASAVVAGRQLGFTREQCTAAAVSAARGYRLAIAQSFAMTALERFYFRVEIDWLEQQANKKEQLVLRKTVDKARQRTSDRVLAEITTTDRQGKHRIIDQAPIIRHDDSVTVAEIAELYDAYRLTVHTEVALLLQQFRVVDTVLRIVGVGSVGTRCSITLLLGPSDEPLFLQVKEAPASVLATYGNLPTSSTRGVADALPGGQGWRVVAGQRILQAASDPFLGWVTMQGRDYYCRQFRDMKGSIELTALSASQFSEYSALCGAVLARAHAQSPEAAVLAGYLGNSARFDDALAAWAQCCADQVERDYSALERAVRSGRLPAETGL
jgi:uncharacterized protein (DUF2252 family)